jgi:hypothetical protein
MCQLSYFAHNQQYNFRKYKEMISSVYKSYKKVQIFRQNLDLIFLCGSLTICLSLNPSPKREGLNH